MKIFLSTSLKNKEEAFRIQTLLEEKGYSVFCCLSDTGEKLTNRALFDHNRDKIIECDLFVAVLKKVGRDVATEIGMAYSLDKPRIGVLYDLESSDVMTYYSFEQLINENDLSDLLENMFSKAERKIGFTHNSLRDHTFTILKRIKGTITSYKLVDDKYVKLLEQKLSDRYGRPVVAVSSGTMGLVITLQTILKSRRKVIVPGISFSASIQAVLQSGGEAVFCDVDPKTWLLDTESVRQLIDEDTGAILAVDLFGVPSVDGKLIELASESNIPIVYDSCQAFGCHSGKRETGTYGTSAVFSLDATKIISGGIGGFVTLGSSLLSEKIGHAKTYGCSKTRKLITVGTNAKMAESAAIFALSSLENVDQRIKQVRENRLMYRVLLSDHRYIQLQDEKDSINASPIFPIFIKHKGSRFVNRVSNLLSQKGIDNKIYNPNNLHQASSFCSVPSTILPVTESMGNSILCLPANPSVTPAYIKKTVRLLKEQIL